MGEHQAQRDNKGRMEVRGQDAASTAVRPFILRAFTVEG